MVRKEAFEYEVISHIATLNECATDTFKEINLVSFNGSEPKIDIRAWRRVGSEEKMLKGITLTVDEAYILVEALQDYLKINN